MPHSLLLYRYLCVGTLLWYQCRGIQLTLDVTSTQGGRPSCGVLTCLENIQDKAFTTDISLHVDSTDSSSPVSNITKMAVYKTDGPGAQSVTGKSSKGSLVASVDSQHPTVTRVANAIKVEGSLGDLVTSLRLELFKQEDCKAQFTCEVLAVDSKGKELVRTSHLLQQPSIAGSGGTGGESWTPAVAMHLVNLVTELNLNVELMKSAMDGYSGRMDRLEDKVETVDKDLSSLIIAQEKEVSGKLGLVEKELSNKLDTFKEGTSDKFASLGKELYKLVLSNENVGDKLDLTAKRLEDQLGQQDDMLSRSLVKLQDTVDDKGKGMSSFKSVVEHFEDELKVKLNNACRDHSNSLQLNITKFSDDMQVFKTSSESQMQENFESLKSELENQGSILTRNLNKALTEAFLNSSMDIETRINKSYDMLDKNIEGYIKEIVSSINQSAIETRSSLRETVLSINVTDLSEIASIVTAVFTPNTCKKGMISILSQSLFPYPLVQPSSDSGLTVPYLCDMVTDGGGWIVIQRRSTGNVDFYRTWAEYKAGFGTLDDDFWLGNDNIHALTTTGEYELRIDMRYIGKSAYAHYDRFSIADEQNKYALTLGAHDGTTGDSLIAHRDKPFSTFDRDNDDSPGNCAQLYTGAWWYERCHDANLNGKWGEQDNKGPRWSFLSGTEPVSFSEMKIRKL